jgi:hypothetical protein
LKRYVAREVFAILRSLRKPNIVQYAGHL